MRIICPNCGAQYEVPNDVVPETGRDVQCSNCGTTWFQRHPSQDTELAEELGQKPLSKEWSDPTPETTPAPEAEAPEPEAAAAEAPEPEAPPPAPAFDGYDEDYYKAPAVAAAPALRRQLDPAIAELLREEAEREARARAEEAQRAQAFETQPDLGLQDPETETERHQRETRERMARLKGEKVQTAPKPTPAEEPPAAPAQSASRRELLPDIDQINSTLRAGTDRRPAEADDHDTPGRAAAPRGEGPAIPAKSGSRAGFITAVVIALGMGGTYAYAPQIVENVPAAQPHLDSYVQWIDGLRLWLDGKAQSLLLWLDSIAAGQ